jgi:hypothetical protein
MARDDITATLSPLIFSPAEAEALTLVPVQTQRKWRERGYIGPAAGFDLFEVGHMAALRALSERGSGPAMASAAARACSIGIAWAALAWVDSYEGDHRLVLAWDADWLAKAQAGEAAARKAVAAMPRGGGPAVREQLEAIAREHSLPWGDQADWLRRRLFRDRGIKAVPARFFAWWADGSEEFAADLSAAFNSGVSSDPRFDGAVTVLDLPAVASSIVARASRAFFNVELSWRASPRNRAARAVPEKVGV